MLLLELLGSYEIGKRKAQSDLHPNIVGLHLNSRVKYDIFASSAMGDAHIYNWATVCI